MTSFSVLFDRRLLRYRRDRLAAKTDRCNFLFEEAASRLAECLDDIRRVFPDTLVLGCRDGTLVHALEGHGGIERVVQADLSPEMVKRARQSHRKYPSGQIFVAADAECLPFSSAAFDLVISSLDFHWINDLPGTLAQIRTVLKPDGLFLANLLGNESLRELRQAWTAAELLVEQGVTPRVSPFIDVIQAAALLQRAGFVLPVTDSDTITVSYPHPLNLFQDLRLMGETNVLSARRRSPTKRRTMAEMIRFYEKSQNEEKRISATFQTITMMGWAPYPSQPHPPKPDAHSSPLERTPRQPFS